MLDTKIGTLENHNSVPGGLGIVTSWQQAPVARSFPASSPGMVVSSKGPDRTWEGEAAGEVSGSSEFS